MANVSTPRKEFIYEKQAFKYPFWLSFKAVYKPKRDNWSIIWSTGHTSIWNIKQTGNIWLYIIVLLYHGLGEYSILIWMLGGIIVQRLSGSPGQALSPL